VAPALADGTIELHQQWVDTGNPLWSRSSAFVDDRWVVKFAWTEAAAHKLLHEAAVLRTLASIDDGPPVAALYAWSDRPALFVTAFQPGEPLAWETIDQMSGERKGVVAAELARLLALLHGREVLTAVRHSGEPMPAPTPQASTAALRDRLAPLLDRRRGERLRDWLHWVDEVLAQPVDDVFLHGDFHGHNLVLDSHDRVMRVLDLEESSVGDHHYDFRYLPAQEHTIELLRRTVAAYEARTHRQVSLERVMAWHVRTACGDALWRTEAGIALPGGGTPAQWIDEIEARFAALGIEPTLRS
jgi:aminoglycoside phosphotransferase (APT) family kinase protein